MDVDFTLPISKPWTGSSAHRASLYAVSTILATPVDIQVPRFVYAVIRLVFEYVVGTNYDASRTPSAKTRCHNFAE